MSKKLIAVALFCLHVIPLNSYATEMSPSDLDGLIQDSQTDAKAAIRAKIEENQRLAVEISRVQDQVTAIQKDIALHGKNAKKNLVIAAGTALGTAIVSGALYATARGELGAELNIMGALITGLTGASYTIIRGGNAGYEYLLLKVDESKLPGLQMQLSVLKQQLDEQTQELLK